MREALGVPFPEGSGSARFLKLRAKALAPSAGRDLLARVERLEKIEAAARKWYDVQRGTMAALSPSGIAMRDALSVLDHIKTQR
jgi:hypothetical protein